MGIRREQVNVEWESGETRLMWNGSQEVWNGTRLMGNEKDKGNMKVGSMLCHVSMFALLIACYW